MNQSRLFLTVMLAALAGMTMASAAKFSPTFWFAVVLIVAAWAIGTKWREP